MELIANAINGKYLRSYHDRGIKRCQSIKASIAYASGQPNLIKDCFDKNIQLQFWCRYDYSVPVSPGILKMFLAMKSPAFICKLVPDRFHAKVIWWEGYGVYIGSANLTDNAWHGNIEAGVFLDDADMIENEMEEKLSDYFHELDTYAVPLTEEIITELENQKRAVANAEADINWLKGNFEAHRLIQKLPPLTSINTKESSSKRKTEFLTEWNQTLQDMRTITERVTTDQYRPSWISSEVPHGVQADQFLHAYYYSVVKEGVRSRHEEFYMRNKDDVETALVKAIEWWRAQDKAPNDEDIIINEWATFLRDHLSEKQILNLDEPTFVEVTKKIHALREHSLRVRKSTLGLDSSVQRTSDECREEFGRWLYKQKSKDGKNVLETLYYVLYDGRVADVPQRICNAYFDDELKVPHLGISTLGEVVGWAMPDRFPPRNGRSSKALRALGYNVKVYSS